MAMSGDDWRGIREALEEIDTQVVRDYVATDEPGSKDERKALDRIAWLLGAIDANVRECITLARFAEGMHERAGAGD